MSVDIARILIRLSSQGSENCPMCLRGAKHIANIHCLDKFWRAVLPRKLAPQEIGRHCNYYNGTNLMYLYENRELGYAVGAVHYGLAMITLTGQPAFFWEHVVKFLEADMTFRKLENLIRPFSLILHVLECLAWQSKDGELFPMPLIVWYLLDGFLLKHKELHELIGKIQIMEYRWLACPLSIA